MADISKIKLPDGTSYDIKDNKSQKIRPSNGTYNISAGAYVGGSGAKKYVRIEIPNITTIWTMLYMEVSIRSSYSFGHGGNVLINAFHTATSPYVWNAFNATIIGTLPTSTEVYGSDGKYIYIMINSLYQNASVDKMLIGDTANSYDCSNVVIDFVDELPESYQTASVRAYTLQLGDLASSLGSGSPASTAKALFDTSTFPRSQTCTGYNRSGTEYSLLFGSGANASYGNILKWGYGTKYLYMLRKYNNEWKSDDWEKVDAGNADTVNSHTVNADVPSGAKFTDTTYTGTSPITVSNANAIGINTASTSGYGATKLNTATNSTSTTEAATPSAVKTAKDRADDAYGKAATVESGLNGTLIYDHTYSISNGVATFTAHVYQKGVEVTSNYADSCFSWSYKLANAVTGTPSVVSLGTGKTKTITISTLGYGGYVLGTFTPPA